MNKKYSTFHLEKKQESTKMLQNISILKKNNFLDRKEASKIRKKKENNKKHIERNKAN